jgi:hypothetical protein
MVVISSDSYVQLHIYVTTMETTILGTNGR